MTSEPRVLFSVAEEIRPPASAGYIDRRVDVPEGTSSLQVELDFHKVTDRFQLYAALIDPDGVFRGHIQCPGGPGPRRQRFRVSEDSASPGCVAGVIPAGSWLLRIDLDRFREAGEYALRLVADAPALPGRVPQRRPATRLRSVDRITAAKPGWLRGELHVHSVHSDGGDLISELIGDARARGLDFLALSDHFTWSHWSELADDGPIITIPSIEVTTHGGHGNAHGLSEWVDVYIDRPGRDGAALLADVHAQGGLFGVNHPFSGQQAWRRSDIRWDDVDLLEVVNQAQYANNDAAIALWDRLLAQGCDIAPVAGTDCHDLNSPHSPLGRVMTAVKTERHDRAGVLQALRDAATVVTRGAHLDLRLRSGESVAGLGESLTAIGPVDIEVDIDVDGPSTLYIMRDGLMWLQDEVDAGARTYTVTDPDPVDGCYRAELHRQPTDARYWASALRSHESFEALTSYIRVTVQ